MSDIPTHIIPPRMEMQFQSKPKDAAKTAEEFEAVFIGQITKMMMEMVEGAEGFSGGHGEEMFRGILAEHMGNSIAKRGGIGLAPQVLAQMVRMQEGSSNGQ